MKGGARPPGPPRAPWLTDDLQALAAQILGSHRDRHGEAIGQAASFSDWWWL